MSAAWIQRLDKYKKGEIIFSEHLKKIKEEEEKIKREKEKTITIAKPRNEIEGVIADTITKSAKKRGKRVLTR